ncbi:MAG TPA: phage tail tape measure C-terminal domain-containing protein [Rhizomicrobium sp.]|jgi:hypothetical protein|nr:phage tail tape measure C-terminal domain-containing protein [Rhizomicrobium sp.]
MAASARQDLFLNITGSADGLSRIAKAAKITLADLGVASGDLQKTMADNFQKLGGSELEANTRTIEASFRRTFANIRASAEASIGKPITAESILSTNISGAQASLAAANGQAASLRGLADAMARIIATNPAATDGQRALAITLEGSALAAKENVVALEQQISTLQALAAESGIAVNAGDRVVASHGRMSSSGMILQHVVRSTSDSFAAGLPPTMIFAEQIGRLGEAAALAGPEGGLGAFGAFMSGPWGLAVTSAISIASVLGKTLLESGDAAKDSAKAHDALKDAMDRLAGSEAALNHQTRQGIIDDINSAAATRQREIATRGLLEAELQRERALAATTASAPTSGRALDESAQYTRRDTSTLANDRIADLDKQLADNQAKITDANKKILDGATKIIQRDVEAATDPRSAINQRFQDQSDRLDRAFQSGKLTPSDYRAQYTALTTQRDSALEAQRPGRRPRADHTSEREANKDRAYQSQLDQAQDAYSKAQADLADTAEARLQVEQQELWAGLQQKKLELDDQVKAGKLTQAQADHLKEIYEGTEELQEINALQKERSRIAREQLEKDQLYLDGQIAILELQKDFAVGSRAQRDLELKILADQEQKERNDLQNKIDTSTDPHAVEDAKTRLAQIDAEHPYKVEQVNRQTASPLEAYRQQLRQNVGDTNDALQGVAVDGLKGLEDGLVGIISGTESVKQAFKQMATSIIADLARIAIEKAIVNALGSGFFGLKDGGSVSGFADGGIPGYASGGHIHGPGTGRSDSILAMVGGRKPIRVANGEFIVNAASTRRYLPLIRAINDNRLPGFADGGLPGGEVPNMRTLSRGDMQALAPAKGGDQYVDLRGAIVDSALWDRVNNIAAYHAKGAEIRATANGAKLGQQQARAASGRRLPTRT